MTLPTLGAAEFRGAGGPESSFTCGRRRAGPAWRLRYHRRESEQAGAKSKAGNGVGSTAKPQNKGMKLTKLSAAPLRGRSAASCPRRPTSDAGTASQLIPGVRPTLRGDALSGVAVGSSC